MNAIANASLFRPPAINGVIDRRILVNYRCDPAIARQLLPAPLQPKLVRGHAMVGICLIRLKQVRPPWIPEWAGLGSENAAHRIAVEWNDRGAQREGVFVVRRDTNSRLNALAGGRVFPGTHHLADFEVWESPHRFKIAMRSRDQETSIRVVARVADESGDAGSIFESIDEASGFYAAGSLGWSPARPGRPLEGLELRTREWRVTPLSIERVESSFFDNRDLFPKGSLQLDNALLMRDVRHSWHARNWTFEPDPI